MAQGQGEALLPLKLYVKQLKKRAATSTTFTPRVGSRIKKLQEFPISVENWLSHGTRYILTDFAVQLGS